MEFPTPRAGQPGLKGEARVEEPDRAGRTIARRTAESRATVPDLELQIDVNASAAVALAAPAEASLTGVLVRAVAAALREHPHANATYRDARFELHPRVNVGVVVHGEDGYATPTILDADTKTLAELSAEIELLTARAQAGELTSPELAGATFTLSDLSRFGVDRWSTVITPSQAASLSAGAVRAAPVIRGGDVVAGQVLTLTLACDHRILFGSRAAAFLRAVAERLTRSAG